jgi:hypothetical protein
MAIGRYPLSVLASIINCLLPLAGGYVVQHLLMPLGVRVGVIANLLGCWHLCTF